MKIDGKAAIVTGGASGLGAAVVRMLAAAGARVAIWDLNAEAGEALAARTGGRFLRCDVADPASVEAALAASEAAHGAARVLVNCAGIAPPARIVSREGTALPSAEFARVVSVNLTGTFNAMSQFAARLHDAPREEEEGGVIVNTASVAAFDGQIGQAAYAASKAGVAGLTLPAARDLARSGIRVMAVAPGIFLTPLLEGLPPDAQESLGRQVPFPPRLGRPEEFADLVGAIIANPMLNGEVIRLDGAIRMAPR